MQGTPSIFETLFRTRDKIHTLVLQEFKLFNDINHSSLLHLKPSYCISVLDLCKKPPSIKVNISQLITPHPVQDRGEQNCLPCLGRQGSKIIPCPAARPSIAQIREYPWSNLSVAGWIEVDSEGFFHVHGRSVFQHKCELREWRRKTKEVL